MKIVFATHNKNKFNEVKQLIPEGIELISLTDLNYFEDIAETESTLEGNALLKANHIFNKFNIPCFADDTGLEVFSLNNEPGVYSARYAGPKNDSEANMEKLLNALEGVSNRKAHFKTVMAYVTPTKSHSFVGICEGEITTHKKGDKGFGYDPIFIPKGYSQSFAEMTGEEKNSISHRGKALSQLISYLQKQTI